MKVKDDKTSYEEVDPEVFVMMEDASSYGVGDNIPLKKRTRDYALRIINLYSALPHSTEGQVLGKQLLRSGTSVGAHYRESLRARSNAEVISKLEGGLQELEESCYWMELLVGSNLVSEKRLSLLVQETDELIAIFTSCVKKIKVRKPKKS